MRNSIYKGKSNDEIDDGVIHIYLFNNSNRDYQVSIVPNQDAPNDIRCFPGKYEQVPEFCSPQIDFQLS